MPALAALLACTVIGIADGDTLTARCSVPEGMTNIQVRLADIDAPEKGQAWGQRSKQHLAEMCFGKSAVLQVRATDRYGRTVARLECEGVDPSAEQVRVGLAMVFDRHVVDRSLYAVQEHARESREGLWSDQLVVAPWDFRSTRVSSKGLTRPASRAP